MTREEKVRIGKQLERMQVDVIEAGFPAASEGDFDAVQAVARAVRDSTICGLARANERDVRRCGEAVRIAARPRVHTFIATSPIHMEKKLRMEPSQVLDAAVAAVKLARNYTDDVEFSAEDAVRSDLDFLCRIFDAVIKAGATTINVPDTVGYSLPAQWGERFSQLIERVPGADQVVWSTHCHNDLGMAVANSLAAVLAGARQVECTINGLGERAGNASLEEIVMAVHTRRDIFPCLTNIDISQIVPASKLVSTITGYPVQPNKAVVGANAFAHESGIHQDGVLKHRETYEIMRAEDVGWHTNRLTLGKLSGRNAFKTRLTELGIELESEEALNAAFKRFKELADKKREIFDEDLQALITEEGLEHVENERFKLVSLTRALRNRRGALRADRAGGSRPRAGGQGARQRAGGRRVQGDRITRQERCRSAAVFGQQHHQRHGFAGRSHGASHQRGADRERPGRRHRHRRGFGQSLRERAEQAAGQRGAGQPADVSGCDWCRQRRLVRWRCELAGDRREPPAERQSEAALGLGQWTIG